MVSPATSVTVLRVHKLPGQLNSHAETDEHREHLELANPCEQHEGAEPGQHRDCTFCLDDLLVVAPHGFCLEEAESNGQCAHGKVKDLSYDPQSTPDLITVEPYCTTNPEEAPLHYPLNRLNLRADQEGTVWKRLPAAKGETRHDSMCLGDRIVHTVGNHTVNNPGVGTGCLTSHNN
jgi:hypothetical protein